VRRAAALVFAIVTGLVALFHVALALGAPMGWLTMGGAFRYRLPPVMRGAAIVQAALMLLFAAIVLARGGVALRDWAPASTKLIWVVVAVLAASLVLNLITASSGERSLWAPVAVLLFVCSFLVARGPRPD
jgi:hypothetical protein